jgi:hypothetical protein
MDAPKVVPRLGTKASSMYLPNRDELSFLRVRALPKASRMGPDSKTCCRMSEVAGDGVASWRAAKYRSRWLVDSVLPAPLSPLLIKGEKSSVNSANKKCCVFLQQATL